MHVIPTYEGCQGAKEDNLTARDEDKLVVETTAVDYAYQCHHTSSTWGPLANEAEESTAGPCFIPPKNFDIFNTALPDHTSKGGISGTFAGHINAYRKPEAEGEVAGVRPESHEAITLQKSIGKRNKYIDCRFGRVVGERGPCVSKFSRNYGKGPGTIKHGASNNEQPAETHTNSGLL